MMVVASEVGVMDFEPNEIKEKGRLQPGKILLIDTEKGEIYYDSELKEQLANAQPYRTWLEKNRVELDELKSGRKIPHKVEKYDKLLRTFGYSREDIERIIIPMCTGGAEPVGSMGNDTPLAILSARPQILFPPTIRPSNQPADRPDPRGTRHEPDRVYRGGGKQYLSSNREPL